MSLPKAPGDPKRLSSHRVATIPFHIEDKTSHWVLGILLTLDFLFVAAYFVSHLPEIRTWTINHRMASLDLRVEANLPTNYAILKLYSGALLACLMIFSFPKDQKIPWFWPISAAVLFFLGLDESAQLHELLGGSIAVKLFGNFLQGDQYAMVLYTVILGAFYLSSLTLFPAKSKPAFFFFIASGVFLILSQVVDLNFNYGMKFMQFFVGAESVATTAWEEGLELLGYTSLVAGMIFGIRDVQKIALDP